MTESEKLGVFQLYPPKNNFEKKCGWQYAPMHMLFDVKQQDLRHNSRLVVGGHVVDSMDHTTYSSTIKYVSVILMLLIAVNNWLGLMDENI